MTRPSRTVGKKSAAKARNASAAKGRKTAKPKRRIAPAATRVKRRSVSDPSKDLKEAREQQTATAEILKVIASSPDDVQPVFEAIVANADRLIGGLSTGVYRFVGGICHLEAFTPVNPAADEMMRARFPRPIAGMWHFERAHAGEIVEFADTETEAAALPLREIARARGFRSLLYVPLMSKGTAIGFIAVSRRNPGSFSAHHVELLQTFADQAVIAMENARLFNETQEALAQQTATSDVLGVISSSVADTTPVFEKILDSCENIFAAEQLGIFLVQPDRQVCAGAWRGAAFEAVIKTLPSPVEQTATGIVIRDRSVLHAPSIALAKDLPRTVRDLRDQIGDASMAWAPMLADEQGVGSIAVLRQPPKPFSSKELSLLKTFADQAVIAIQNTRLFNETREALERQTATADILKVIASSPSDVQPVFEAVAASANRLIGGLSTAVLRFINGEVHLASFTPISPEADAVLKSNFPGPITDFEPFGAGSQGKMVQITDAEAAEDERARQIARARGYRSALLVPLMNAGRAIGLIGVTRAAPGTFSPHHVQLLQAFADQAVIAIENTRLFNETKEALARQTATSDVLKVIASSPSNLQPVFDAIAERSKALIGAHSTVVVRYVHGMIELAAFTPVNPEADAVLQTFFPRLPTADDLQTEKVLRGEIAQISDAGSELRGNVMHDVARARGWRSRLLVPLKDETGVIGWISVTRKEAGGFVDKDVELLQIFADQAVIAIGNVRLFEEVQVRTRDLQESLRQQTATADVLKVISRSAFDLNSVMDTLTSSAAELCKAEVSALYLREGDVLVARGVAHADATQVDFLRRTPLQIDDSTYIGRTFQAAAVRNIADVATETETGQLKRFGEVLGFRSIVFVPLMRELSSVGIFALARARTGQFSEREVELVQTFADQAVIAVENVRLFDEVRQRTRELSESLEQQVATSEVLQVISSSPGELKPAFQSMLANATRLCEAECGVMWLREGDDFRSAAIHGPLPPAYVEQWRSGTPVHPNPHGPLTILAQTRKTVHVPDMREDRSYLDRHPLPVAAVDVAGIRTLLLVPMSKEDELVGGIAVYRQEVRPFTDKQIALVQNFAAQAVIAIENARLLNELRQRTSDLAESLQQQTATADVLQVISESPGDLEPVFEEMLVNATRVCSAKFGSMLLAENGSMRPAAQYNVPAEFAAARRDRVLTPHPKSALAKAISTKQVVHVADMRTTEAYLERSPASIELVELGGARTVAIVPMLRDDEVIGAITVYRNEVQLFSDKQIELLSNFAKQAVIAIENARLLKELRQRTDDLSQSLDDLRTAQDRLVQTEKLASLGQLTAGIAHEIKNPLNFVNNFSAVSAELTDELNDVLKPVVLDRKVRGEVDELTGMLKDNLEKVVQHGKRADSIVKNMLLHSRQGGGELGPADINALVDESLNLAYHGARAENPQFNVTLRRNFDPDVGTFEVFPQEITRVLLNLISNGFYAVTRRKVENEGVGFEPAVSATTRAYDDHVEIRIRDNGTGIPPEVREKIFNPFFTTKPAGEGTGLGLSMSHDIVVKQHGGTIDVDTKPGIFTEFIITLPRTIIPPKTAGGTN